VASQILAAGSKPPRPAAASACPLRRASAKRRREVGSTLNAKEFWLGELRGLALPAYPPTSLPACSGVRARSTPRVAGSAHRQAGARGQPRAVRRSTRHAVVEAAPSPPDRVPLPRVVRLLGACSRDSGSAMGRAVASDAYRARRLSRSWFSSASSCFLRPRGPGRGLGEVVQPCVPCCEAHANGDCLAYWRRFAGLCGSCWVRRRATCLFLRTASLCAVGWPVRYRFAPLNAADLSYARDPLSPQMRGEGDGEGSSRSLGAAIATTLEPRIGDSAATRVPGNRPESGLRTAGPTVFGGRR
jgi:hypothetical protein